MYFSYEGWVIEGQNVYHDDPQETNIVSSTQRQVMIHYTFHITVYLHLCLSNMYLHFAV